jgi:hypothetical protein
MGHASVLVFRGRELACLIWAGILLRREARMFGLRLRGQWLVPIILGMASQVFVCPVCGVGRDGTASVYLMTAVLMCIAPLVMLGAMAYYLFR